MSLLSSPALSTLAGRLDRGRGEPPPGVEPGLLSSTRVDMRASSSFRLSARGVGDTSWHRESARYYIQMAADRSIWRIGTAAARTKLCLLDEPSLVRNSRWRFSSASFAFFANISSLRCCIVSAVHSWCSRVCWNSRRSLAVDESCSADRVREKAMRIIRQLEV